MSCVPSHVPCSTPLVCQEASWGLGFAGEGHLITPAMAITRQGGVATDSDRSWGLEGSWGEGEQRGTGTLQGRSKAESPGARVGRASAAGSQEDCIPGRASTAASGPRGRGTPRAWGEGCSPASQPMSGTRFSQPQARGGRATALSSPGWLWEFREPSSSLTTRGTHGAACGVQVTGGTQSTFEILAHGLPDGGAGGSAQYRALALPGKEGGHGWSQWLARTSLPPDRLW